MLQVRVSAQSEHDRTHCTQPCSCRHGRDTLKCGSLSLHRASAPRAAAEAVHARATVPLQQVHAGRHVSAACVGAVVGVSRAAAAESGGGLPEWRRCCWQTDALLSRYVNEGYLTLIVVGLVSFLSLIQKAADPTRFVPRLGVIRVIRVSWIGARFPRPLRPAKVSEVTPWVFCMTVVCMRLAMRSKNW